ncbi:MAG: membrane protease YdiL (CAAX protease family) [Oleiphilaceae bacterium]
MDIIISQGTVVCFSIYAILNVVFIKTKPCQKIKTCFFLLLALVLSAVAFKLIALYALPFIVVLFTTAFVYASSQAATKKLTLILLSALALAFSLHVIPGFNNELLFSREQFGLSDLPFKLYANLDKALAGFAILIAVGQKLTWRISVNMLKLILCTTLLFFSLCLLLGAKLDPKIGELTFAFIFFNLLVTCIAEEAFFRLVIQNAAHNFSKGFMGGWLAVFVTAVIFMLAHFHTGVGSEKRLLLIFIAGLLYGGIYLKSKSFGSAVIAHFTINITYFSFFAFPATFN